MVILIHFADHGATIRQHYTYDSFLASEQQLLVSAGHKYGEFDAIKALRLELATELARRFLRD